MDVSKASQNHTWPRSTTNTTFACFCRGTRIYMYPPPLPAPPPPPPPHPPTPPKKKKKKKRERERKEEEEDRIPQNRVPELSAAGGPGVCTAAPRVVGRRGHASGRDGQARAVHEGGHVRPDDHGHGLEEAEGRPADRGRLRLQRLGR